MSAILILAPAIIAGWPAITAAAAGAAAAMGMSVFGEAKDAIRENQPVERLTEVEMTMEDSEVLGETLTGTQQIVMKKEDITARIFHDERGELKVCVQGANKSKAELEQFGQAIVDKMSQVFIYNKVVTELKARNLEVVRQEVAEDNSVRIHLKHDIE